MRKGLLLLVIALLIIFLPKTLAFAQRFPDVPPTHWAFYNIESLASKGIITGYPDGLFRPEAHISRSQIAKLVVSSKASSLNTTFKGYFKDVPQTHWAWRYIETAYEQGLIKGFPDKTFKPEDPATRAEAVTILMRDHPLDTSGTPFTDVPSNHRAYPYIMTAKNARIVGGYPDGTFRPERFVTRAEAAKIVDTMLSR
ncbi:MAG: S-layer homology domain-containing protein [Actinomycetota bacterium]